MKNDTGSSSNEKKESNLGIKQPDDKHNLLH